MKLNNVIARLRRLEEKGFDLREIKTDYGTAVVIWPRSGLVTINGSMSVVRNMEGGGGPLLITVPDEQMKEDVDWHLRNGLPFGQSGQNIVMTTEELLESKVVTDSILLLPGVYPEDVIPHLRKPPGFIVDLDNVNGIENSFKERLFSKSMKKTSKKQRIQDFVNVNKSLEKFPYGGQLAVRAAEREMENGFPEKVLSEIKENTVDEKLDEYKQLLEDYCRLYQTLDYGGGLAGTDYYDRRYVVFYLIKEGLKRGSGEEKKKKLLEEARALAKENKTKQEQLKNSKYDLPFHRMTQESEFLLNYPGEAERQEVLKALEVIRSDEKIGLLNDHRTKLDRFANTIYGILYDVLLERYREFPFLGQPENLRNFADLLFEYPEVLKTRKEGNKNDEKN